MGTVDRGFAAMKQPRHRFRRSPNKKQPPVEKLIEMLATMSYQEIAEATQVTRHTVANWISRNNLSGHRQKTVGQKLCDTSHEARMQAEYEAKLWAMVRKPMGEPFGGSGWFNLGGLRGAV